MESYFQHSQKPNYEELIAISSNTGLDRDVVRVWFSNRRQKERRQRDSEGGNVFIRSTTSPAAAVPVPLVITSKPAGDSVLDSWFSSPVATAEGPSFQSADFGLMAAAAVGRGPDEFLAKNESQSAVVQPVSLFDGSSSLAESSWTSAPSKHLAGGSASCLDDQSSSDNCVGKSTSVIVSRRTVHLREPPQVITGFENTFLMTPRVEETADKSDDDWTGCY
jgi:hypothetical protein